MKRYKGERRFGVGHEEQYRTVAGPRVGDSLDERRVVIPENSCWSL